MKRFKSIGFVMFGAAATLQGCGFVSSSHDFNQEIAACKGLKDISLIGEGEFRKPDRNSAKFDDIRAQLNEEKIPKMIYNFHVETMHYGSTGIINGKTGKQITNISFPIREGQVGGNAKGKKGLICIARKNKKSKTQIYVAP